MEVGTTKRSKIRTVDFCDTLAAILKAARTEQHKNRFKYGELYSLNYYRQVQEERPQLLRAVHSAKVGGSAGGLPGDRLRLPPPGRMPELFMAADLRKMQEYQGFSEKRIDKPGFIGKNMLRPSSCMDVWMGKSRQPSVRGPRGVFTVFPHLARKDCSLQMHCALFFVPPFCTVAAQTGRA